jgi:hypothetical protein
VPVPLLCLRQIPRHGGHRGRQSRVPSAGHLVMASERREPASPHHDRPARAQALHHGHKRTIREAASHAEPVGAQPRAETAGTTQWACRRLERASDRDATGIPDDSASELEQAKRWRQRAGKLQATADGMKCPSARETLVYVARSYLALAEAAEARAATASSWAP